MFAHPPSNRRRWNPLQRRGRPDRDYQLRKEHGERAERIAAGSFSSVAAAMISAAAGGHTSDG